MSCYLVVLSLLLYLTAIQVIRTSGDRPAMTSTPDHPTQVFIGENVSLAWNYYFPTHLNILEISFGLWKSPGYISRKLMAVSSNGVQVRKGYESKVSWAGNLTSKAAVFVLYDVQPADGKKTFAVNIEFGTHYQPLTSTVRLQVNAKVPPNLPQITHVSEPALLETGETVSLTCTASGLPPVHVRWYKGGKVQANGVSKVTFTLHNITSEDWGTCVCVASNSGGRDQKVVVIKVRPDSPAILNTVTKAHNKSLTLRWSAVRSEGISLTWYTVYHRVLHVTNDVITRKEPWLRENTTRLTYHKNLEADTWYSFGVTAWNKWGESLLSNDYIITLLADIDVSIDNHKKRKKGQTTDLIHTEPLAVISPTADSQMETPMKYVYVGAGSTAVIVFIILIVVTRFKWRKFNRRQRNNPGGRDNPRTSQVYFTSQEDPSHEKAEGIVEGRGSTDRISELSLENPLISTPSTMLELDIRPVETRFLEMEVRPGLVTTTADSTPTGATVEQSESETRVYDEVGDVPSRPSMVTSLAKPESESKRRVYDEVDDVPSRPSMAKRLVKPELKLHPNTVKGMAGRPHGGVSDSEGYLRPVDDKMSDSRNKDDIGLCKSREGRNKDDVGLCKSREGRKGKWWRPRLENLGEREPDKTLKCKPSASSNTLPSPSNGREHDLPFDKNKGQRSGCSRHVTQSGYLAPNDEKATTTERLHTYENDMCRRTICPNETKHLSPQGNTLQTQHNEPQYTLVQCHTNWEIPPTKLSLFDRIGGGAFGEVWSGVSCDVGGAPGWSMVAVKMVKEGSENRKEDLRDLLSELTLLKKLETHPNVIRLLGCVTKDTVEASDGRLLGPPLVILEFVPHGDLLGYLRKSRGERDDYYPLKASEVARRIDKQQLYGFASDVARGMEFLSRNQLIHRDLAARNVLVGTDERCKITDFGMARDLGKSEIYLRRRSNGLMPVKWMACESFQGRQEFTIKSDVWSYGVVLYEIFTLGGRPYDGMKGEDVMRFVASGGRLKRLPSISPELYDVMLHCWNEDPVKRPTFDCLASAIDTLACK